MGLEMGMDKKQAEALRRLYRRCTGDPVQFRFVVTAVLLAVIIGTVEMPLAARIVTARQRLADAKEHATTAHEVRGYAEQQAIYEPRVAVSADIMDWQNYVLELLAHTTATLVSLEPKLPEAHGGFQVIDMELVAKGNSYREFVGFVDRLERGERIVRVEKVRLEKQQTSIYLTCIIKGLVKSSAKAAEDAPADGEGEPPGDTADDTAGDTADGAPEDAEAAGPESAAGDAAEGPAR
jgi:hypothetical protein